MAASNAQVQQYVSDRIRVRAEQIRNLLIDLQDDKDLIGDVYANVNDGGSTWADANASNPPHLLTKSDVLAYNSLITDLIDDIGGNANYPTVLLACVRPPA